MGFFKVMDSRTGKRLSKATYLTDESAQRAIDSWARYARRSSKDYSWLPFAVIVED